MGLEPTAYALEGHCSFHLRYIPMCVSVSCMPTFKARTPSNTYGYFYFRRASASYLLVGSYPTAWGTDCHSAATPPLGAASPKCADASLPISVCDCATHTVSDQLGTIGTEGFEPSIRLSLLFSVYTPLLPIKLRSETAIRRLAIMFFVPCVALSMRHHGKYVGEDLHLT